MAKVEEYSTNFLSALGCTECDYVVRPTIYSFFCTICPDCGATLKKVVGKWLVRKTTSLFFCKEEYITFVPRKSLGDEVVK